MHEKNRAIFLYKFLLRKNKIFYEILGNNNLTYNILLVAYNVK